MHSEILNDKQMQLLPLMAQFRREYYLVGGTAIALYIGHGRCPGCSIRPVRKQ